MLTRKSDRVLIIGDLHIGWEVSLAQKGIHVPSQTGKLLNNLMQAIDDARPTTLIFIGDVKHAVSRVELEEWRDVPEFFEKVLKAVPDVRVVLGNHDGNLEPLTPPEVKLIPSSGIVWHDVGILHGHAWPTPDLLACETLVMGHVHPVIMLRDPLGFRILRQVWVKTQCDGATMAGGLFKHLGLKCERSPEEELEERFQVNLNKSQQCIIMPSFNDFLSGATINKKVIERLRDAPDEYTGPILRSGALDVENAEIYLTDGTYLGKNSQLKEKS